MDGSSPAERESVPDLAAPKQTLDGRLQLAVVMPIFNDFTAFSRMCREIDAQAATWNAEVSIIGVDDGSSDYTGLSSFEQPPANVGHLKLVKLRCNLGHQRAIAIGLLDAAKDLDLNAVIVADCDGEDRPADLTRLISEFRAFPGSVIVGRRSKRSESLRFRSFYALYKLLFWVVAGRRIDFGNFVLLPRPWLLHLVNMPETWNHTAAALLRSRLPLRSVSCVRGTRFSGQSSMNFVTLLIHGLSAIAVFSDAVFARALICSGTITVFAGVMAVVAVVIRFLTDLAIPGWATVVVGFGLVILSQSLFFSMMAGLMMLKDRSSAVFVPAEHAEAFVGSHITLFRRRLDQASLRAAAR